ncbi:RFX DNA-binding domain-containing protein [Peziza echinospora]|nr:RFX DNA-binding domain-containing protein [Peziza echinospora]
MAGEDSQPGPSSSPVVKRGSVFEDSDQELKRLAAENSAVPLKELATRVRDDENGPKAERARQILGMRWLLTSCERAADSSIAVPRNRVYARYVSMCANERIKPLNPASFGKLVRLMYPEIKTRRLGVRGHSKYHYCGIKLKGDPSSPVPKASQGSASGSEPPPQMAGEDHLHVAHNGSQPSSEFHIISLFPASNGHTSNTHTQRPYPDLSPIATFLQLDICFPSQEINDNALPSQRIELPEISPYAPPKHDHDTIASFSEIYRSHSTSLVECFRYMRLKQFFHLFATFLGTLTSPVHKLFAEPSIAEWIREADWTTYKYIIQLLSPLALQVLPPAVIAALKHFSANLTTHISTIFINEHTHTVEAKKEPAAIFSTLLNRLLRVNEAAHAAARILVHGPDRQIMREEWRQHVKCKSIVEREVPCRAAAVQRILEDEIMSLLQPQQEGSDPAPPSAGDDDDIDGMTTTESVLDRWTQFLAQLPHRFPEVPPRLFLLCVGAIATAALRDLTVAGSDSFGGWWIVRCWIDEWIGWMAERGGFLMHGVNDKPRMIVCQEKEEEDDDLDLAQDGCGNNSDSDLGLDDSGISMMRDDLLCINGELGRTGMVD